MHRCEQDLPCYRGDDGGIDQCFEDPEGALWGGDIDFLSQVNFCPFCGFKAKIPAYQPERSKREDPVLTMAKFTGDAMRRWEDNAIQECGALNIVETQ